MGANENQERVFLSDGGFMVTSARFVVPGQTFAMSGITSVRHSRTPRKWLFGALLIFMSVPMTSTGASIASSGSSSSPLIFGLILMAVGISLIWRGRPQSQVRLQSASGETTALSSRNDALVRRVVSALNDSIIYRG